MDKELEDIIENISVKIKALNNATPLFKPEPYAGNLLVDPIIVATLDYYWEKLAKELIPIIRKSIEAERG